MSSAQRESYLNGTASADAASAPVSTRCKARKVSLWDRMKASDRNTRTTAPPQAAPSHPISLWEKWTGKRIVQDATAAPQQQQSTQGSVSVFRFGFGDASSPASAAAASLATEAAPAATADTPFRFGFDSADISAADDVAAPRIAAESTPLEADLQRLQLNDKPAASSTGVFRFNFGGDDN